MAIPSFEELLKKAQTLSEQNAERDASTRTNTALASGVSGFFDKLLNTPSGKREVYPGYLNETGEYKNYDTPMRTGQSMGERMLGSLFGTNVNQPAPPPNSIPITSDQAVTLRSNQALLGAKFNNQQALQNQRLASALEIAKLRAKSGGKALAAAIPLGETTTNYIWNLVHGTDAPQGTILRKGEADTLLRSKFGDENIFWKGVDADIKMNKDILGQVQPEAKTAIESDIEKHKKPTKTMFGEDAKINVTRISDGVTGTINQSEFDPKIYKKR